MRITVKTNLSFSAIFECSNVNFCKGARDRFFYDMFHVCKSIKLIYFPVRELYALQNIYCAIFYAF